MDSDLYTVYVATTLEEADIIAAWLEAQGFDPQVPDRNTAAAFQGIAPALTSGGGIRVQVVGQEEAQRATALLQTRKPAHPPQTGTVLAECEECGRNSSFPAECGGRVETCPHCGKFLDVPEAADP